MRDIHTMLGVFKCLVPGRLTDIHSTIDSIKSSASFAPPELVGLHWRRLGEMMAAQEAQHGSQPWFKNCEAVLRDVNIDSVNLEARKEAAADPPLL